MKATDVDVPKLFSWLGVRPDIKAHAKVEIHRVKEESGFLPLAVPEIDPNFVYAIFVDYAKNGTQTPLKVQPLEEEPDLRRRHFPVLGVGNEHRRPRAPDPRTQQSPSTRMPRTATAPASSSSCRSPTSLPSTTGTLNEICNQTPTDLVQCYAGTGSAGYDGAATGQGLAFIHSFATTANGTPAGAAAARRTAHQHDLHRRSRHRKPLGPYYVNDDSDCTVGVTAKVDFGVQATPPDGDHHEEAEPGRHLCGSQLERWALKWKSTAGKISTWEGTMSVPVASGPQVLSLSWKDKTSGTSCSSPNSGSFGTAAMSYATDDSSGPVGYVKLTASGQSATCPGGAGVVDANSTSRGNYCYSVVVGLDQPLVLKTGATPASSCASRASRRARAVPGPPTSTGRSSAMRAGR